MLNNLRVVIISTCDECPHFDDEYYDYMHTCTKLDREIKMGAGGHLIPDDCPLTKVDMTFNKEGTPHDQ